MGNAVGTIAGSDSGIRELVIFTGTVSFRRVMAVKISIVMEMIQFFNYVFVFHFPAFKMIFKL
jgi:hypothetical protein